MVYQDNRIITLNSNNEDLNRLTAQKMLHEEIVEVCSSILKELHSRTFQLKEFITWERFIQGV